MERNSAKKWRLPDTGNRFRSDRGRASGGQLSGIRRNGRPASRVLRTGQAPALQTRSRQRAERHLSGDERESGISRSTMPIQARRSGWTALIPPRWMLNLPGWTKTRIVGVTVWQWTGLRRGASGCHACLFSALHRLAHRLAADREDGSGLFWPALVTPLAHYSCGGVRHTAALYDSAHQRNTPDRDGIRPNRRAVPQRRVAVVCRQRDDRRGDRRLRSI